MAQYVAAAVDGRIPDGVFLLHHHAGEQSLATQLPCHLVSFPSSSSHLVLLQVQPDHFWGFLGCFYVIGLFLVLTFARGMLLWDDWGCGAVPLDEQQQAAALMPELRHPNPDRRLHAASQLRDSA